MRTEAEYKAARSRIQHKYYVAHKDKIAAYLAEYAKSPARKAVTKKYREANKAACHARSAAWTKTAVGKVSRLATKARYRAAGALSASEVKAVIAAANGMCEYCGREASLELDHIVPVSRGGKSEIGNMAAACRKCNRSKSDKLPDEWAMEMAI
jgi:5-methylcytosine-specific restriction endonuclease McrA